METLTYRAKPTYWFFFVPFAICAVLGIAGVIVAEIFMPDNVEGLRGRLAIYRHLGTASFVWSIVAVWSWHKLQTTRALLKRRAGLLQNNKVND